MVWVCVYVHIRGGKLRYVERQNVCVCVCGVDIVIDAVSRKDFKAEMRMKMRS